MIPAPVTPPPDTRYDLVCIGGGLAATALLIDLLPRLDAGRDWRIAVVDSGGWFGGGVTYSGPAAMDTLLQNPVDAMPASLGAWLRDTALDHIQTWADAGSRGTRRWFQRDRDALACGDVDGLFVPRALYGHVQTSRYAQAMTDASPFSRVDHIIGRVTAMHRQGDALRLDLSGTTTGALETGHAVLCPGLIPRPPLPAALDYLTDAPDDFIAILADESGANGRGVAMIGANAAAMDVIHILDLYADRLLPKTQLSILARSGRLPPALTDAPGAPPPETTLLSGRPLPTNASDLVACVQRDGQTYLDAGVAPATLGTNGGMSALIVGLNALPPADRAAVLQGAGQALSILSRRAVPAYAGAAARLLGSHRIAVEKTTVLGADPAARGAHLTLSTEDAQRHVHRIIDCRGAGTLADTSDPLLRTLRAGALGVVSNAADSGFVVDDALCAAPGLHILGDLLTGYDGAHGAVWHLQSAPRIETYAEVLAKALAPRLRAAAATASR